MEERTLNIDLNFPIPISDEAHFFGREDDWRQVRSCFLEPNLRPVILLGERQIGKTSFLRISTQRLAALSDCDFIPVSLTQNSNVLSYETFATTAFTDLLKAIENNRPGNSVQADLDPQTPLTVERFIANLERVLTGCPGKTLILCIDGFDDLLQPLIREGLTAEIDSIVNLLSAIVQVQHRLAITVYITLSRIPDVFLKSDIPNRILETARLVELRPFSVAEASAMVRGLLEPRVQISDAALKRMYAYTGGSPYLVKFFLDILLHHADFVSNPKTISVQWIDRVNSLAAREWGHSLVFQNIFESYFSIQERALTLLLTRLERAISLNELNLLGAQFITAANSLVRRAYLLRQDQNFTWRVLFIPEWLRHWERFEEELEHLDIPRLIDILSIDIWIDKATKKVFFRQKPIQLTNREYEVLECMCIHQGKLVSYDQIAGHIWPVGRDFEMFSLGAINMAVSRLRKKLKDENRNTAYIETVVGQGYILHQASFLSEQTNF